MTLTTYLSIASSLLALQNGVVHGLPVRYGQFFRKPPEDILKSLVVFHRVHEDRDDGVVVAVLHPGQAMPTPVFNPAPVHDRPSILRTRALFFGIFNGLARLPQTCVDESGGKRLFTYRYVCSSRVSLSLHKEVSIPQENKRRVCAFTASSPQVLPARFRRDECLSSVACATGLLIVTLLCLA